MSGQRVIVIGGGVIGLSTAWELLRRGHPVTVLEAREDIGLGTSFANGGLLTPSLCEPWNAPGVFGALVASFLRSHSPMKLRVSAVPSLLGWGARFLRNSTIARHTGAARANFALATYSLARMRELKGHLRFVNDGAKLGTLRLFRSARDLDKSIAAARRLQLPGLQCKLMNTAEVVSAEPSLADIAGQIVGALYYPDDETGDAHKFCVALAKAFQALGGEIRNCSRVIGFDIRANQVHGVRLPYEVLPTNRVVAAMGVATSKMMRDYGVKLPIAPIKGYTVTVDVSHLDRRPRRPVIDDLMHAAVVPMGGRLRVAGIADFERDNAPCRPERVASLLAAFAAIYPRIAKQIDFSAGSTWCAHRPVSADGVPYIGATHVGGLYINAGHGHLGWTMAAGSAHLLSDVITGGKSELDLLPYSPTR